MITQYVAFLSALVQLDWGSLRVIAWYIIAFDFDIKIYINIVQHSF